MFDLFWVVSSVILMNCLVLGEDDDDEEKWTDYAVAERVLIIIIGKYIQCFKAKVMIFGSFCNDCALHLLGLLHQTRKNFNGNIKQAPCVVAQLNII